ncbi:MAG TPA: hypothetical protein ENK09_08835 [Nitrospirae bacterium]|nr:hypothetical protein [Nitrospirota bacterium]
MRGDSIYSRLALIVIICLVGFLFSVYKINAYAQEEGKYIEEGADTVLPGDEVVVGGVTWQKGSIMVINEEEYPLCRRVKVFNENGQAIKMRLLKEAAEVKAFYSNREDCVRKVKILKFKS